MSSESLPPSVTAISPVDPSIVRVLRSIDPIAREVDCPYFVAGATARDLVLVNFFTVSGQGELLAISISGSQSKTGSSSPD
jgi:hypothetical protein